MTAHLIYITTRDKEEARSIGRSLVASHLAACVNIFTGMESIYYWDDELQQDHEAVLIAKTTENRVRDVINAVRQQHSYDCPCIVSFPIAQGHTDYLDWIAGQVS